MNGDHHSQITVPHVVVIMPIYRDVALTLEAIQAALPGISQIPFAKLLLINDASPETGMHTALLNIAHHHKTQVLLLEHSSNQGFVSSVNQGIRIFPDHDVVLLNNDAIVPTDWLGRLIEEAYSQPRVATITPLSNSTTICTFPEFMQENDLPFGFDVNTVDSVFSKPKLKMVETPTGIGFCMYIRRKALETIGEFDEKTFNRGYGEENDFCQRAIQCGLVNYITPNLYVYHRGSVSFGAEKKRLLDKAFQILEQRYPAYHRDIRRFIEHDPLKFARIVRMAKLLAKIEKPKILHISHGIGGGVDQHIEELSEYIQNSAYSLVLIPIKNKGVKLYLGSQNSTNALFFEIPKRYHDLVQLLKSLGISMVHYHHVLNYDKDILLLPHALGCPYDVTIHDYYFINGNPTLTDTFGIYPGNHHHKHPLYPLPKGISPKQWRDAYRPLIEQANRVIFPSRATHQLFSGFYNITNNKIVDHPEKERDCHSKLKYLKKRDHYKIGIIGALGKEKGADLLEEIASLSKKQGCNFEFILIGFAYKILKNVTSTGPYHRSNLKQLIKNHTPDLIFFPAQWPETYSYTLSYALDSGLPIIAPQIGAFPERLVGRKNVHLFEYPSTPLQILQIIIDFVGSGGFSSQINDIYTDPKKEIPYFYDQDYVDNLKIEKQPIHLDHQVLENCLSIESQKNLRQFLFVWLYALYVNPHLKWLSRSMSPTLLHAIKRTLTRTTLVQLSTPQHQTESLIKFFLSKKTTKPSSSRTNVQQ